MGKSEQVKIPKKPVWKTLREKLDCGHCETFRSCSHQGYFAENLDTLMDCPKKAAPINFFLNYVSAIPIFFLVRKVFSLNSEKFFLSLFISLVILFFYDMFFVAFEKVIRKIFITLEDKRREKYQQTLEKIKRMKSEKEEQERQEKEREKQRLKEIEDAHAIYNRFKELESSKVIKERFNKPYDEMLVGLKEVCDDLQLEHFSKRMVKNLFNFYLPELLEASEKFVAEYEKELLSPKELAIFRKLLKTAEENFRTVKRAMCQKENVSLYVNMIELDEALSSNKEVRR